MEGHPRGQDQVLIPEELTESFQPIVGQAVTLRPLRPDDADIEHAFVSGLSPDTRHSRLLGGARRVTPDYIRSLTTVDYARDMAIAATVMLGERESLIGVARYVLEADGRSCEFAIVIADAWQGRGIGRRLMGKLIEVARQRGVPRIYGEVLASNRPMLEFMKQLGFELKRHPDDATLVRGERAP